MDSSGEAAPTRKPAAATPRSSRDRAARRMSFPCFLITASPRKAESAREAPSCSSRWPRAASQSWARRRAMASSTAWTIVAWAFGPAAVHRDGQPASPARFGVRQVAHFLEELHQQRGLPRSRRPFNHNGGVAALPHGQRVCRFRKARISRSRPEKKGWPRSPMSARSSFARNEDRETRSWPRRRPSSM